MDLEHTDAQSTSPDSSAVNQEGIPSIPNYDMLGVVGRGGMGIVVKARDLQLNRLVAIKLPLLSHIATALDRTRFLREAQSAAKLEHANICAIHAVGEVDERPFIAMAFVDGDNLDGWASAKQRTPHEVARMVAVLARAVGYAHEHKVIHRDLKPSNVLVSARSHQPVLMDFGLAKEIGEQQSEMTQSGQIMGTPAYMAPEQAAGDIKRIGPPADIYALGAILYKLLTGKQVFESKVGVGELLKKVQTEEPRSPRSINSAIHIDLETICLKCLAKEPEARYASATALADDLERFTNGEAIEARREGMLRKIRRKLRRNRVTTAAFATSLIAVVLVAVWFARFREDRTARQREDSIKQLEQDLDADLVRDVWNDEALARIDERVTAIGERDPQRGTIARGKVNEGLFASANRLVDRGRLDADDWAQITRYVALLEARDDGTLAAQLRAKARDRERGWNSIVDFHAPYANAEAAFTAGFGQVLVQNQKCEIRGNGQPREIVHALTAHRVHGNMQAVLQVGANWQRGLRVGFGLNQPGPQEFYSAYYCVLSTVPWETVEDLIKWPTFEEARIKGSPYYLSIARGKVRVGEIQIMPIALPSGPLRIFVQRENDTITVQLQQEKPLIVTDMFPLPARGNTVILAPGGTELVSLEISEQGAPAGASPLEKGDEHYTAGRYQEAATFYQAQARASAGTPDAEEARLKEAIALYSLSRWGNAIPILDEVMKATDRRRATLAACYRIAIAIQEKHIDQATQLLQSLIVQQDSEGVARLATLLPEDVRNVILGAYRSSAAGLKLLIPDPDRIANMKLFMLAEKALGVSNTNHGWSRIAYLRALRASPDLRLHDEAIALLKVWLKELPLDDTVMGVLFTNEFGWLMRDIGRPDAALLEVDSRLFVNGHIRSDGVTPLLIERARLLIAKGNWKEAEENLDTFFQRPREQAFGNRVNSDAALVLGFVREHRGDAKGAQEIWRRIAYTGDFRFADQADRTSGLLGLLNTAFLGFLTDTIKEPDLESLLRSMMQSLEFGNLALAYLNRTEIDSMTRTMYKVGQSAKFKEFIRDYSFQSIRFRDCFDRPIRLFGIDAFNELLFDGKMTENQDKLIRQFVDDGLHAAFAGKLDSKQAFKSVNVLRGNNDFYGWKSLSPSLDPTLRGPAAYIFAMRYLQLKRPKDAAMFFGDALKDAKPDSLLQRMANEELAKIPKK